jgi:hypothetical protein
VTTPRLANSRSGSGAAGWRLVPASDPQALTDIGDRFPPYPKGAVVKVPRRTQNGWSLRVAANGKSSTFAIDRKTFLVRSITAREAGQHLEEHISNLASTPNLPSPRPRC